VLERGGVRNKDRVLEDIQTRGVFTNMHGDCISRGAPLSMWKWSTRVRSIRTYDELLIKNLGPRCAV
jgi:hypothetical protein